MAHRLSTIHDFAQEPPIAECRDVWAENGQLSSTGMLSRALTAHLASGFRTIVIGPDAAEVRAWVSALAAVTPPQLLEMTPVYEFASEQEAVLSDLSQFGSPPLLPALLLAQPFLPHLALQGCVMSQELDPLSLLVTIPGSVAIVDLAARDAVLLDLSTQRFARRELLMVLGTELWVPGKGSPEGLLQHVDHVRALCDNMTILFLQNRRAPTPTPLVAGLIRSLERVRQPPLRHRLLSAFVRNLMAQSSAVLEVVAQSRLSRQITIEDLHDPTPKELETAAELLGVTADLEVIAAVAGRMEHSEFALPASAKLQQPLDLLASVRAL